MLKKAIPFLIITLLIAASDAGAVFWYKKQTLKQSQNQTAQVEALQKQISGLQTQLTQEGKQQSTALSAQEATLTEALMLQQSRLTQN